MVSVGRQATGLLGRDLDARHASVHSWGTWNKLLVFSELVFSGLWDHSEEEDKAMLCPHKGSKQRFLSSLSCMTWDVPLWPFPDPFTPSSDADPIQTKANIWKMPELIQRECSLMYLALSSLSDLNKWTVSSLFLSSLPSPTVAHLASAVNKALY